MCAYTRLKCIVASAAIFHCVVNFFLSLSLSWILIDYHCFSFFFVSGKGHFLPHSTRYGRPQFSSLNHKSNFFLQVVRFFSLALCSIIFVVFAALLHIFKMDFVHVALYMRKLSKKLHSSLLRLRSVTSFNIFLESHFLNTQITK